MVGEDAFGVNAGVGTVSWGVLQLKLVSSKRLEGFEGLSPCGFSLEEKSHFPLRLGLGRASGGRWQPSQSRAERGV